MPAVIIDGRAVANEMRADVRARAEALRLRGVSPRLVVSLVGQDPESVAYTRNLERAGARVAIDVTLNALPAAASESDLRARLSALGEDPTVHGIILAQPLPAHLAIARVAGALPAAKDVDGTNPPGPFAPATPAAVMELLERSPAWPLSGKRALVIGRSRVVGLPVAHLLLAQNATVTIAHSKTLDLDRHLRDAEIVVAAAGVPGLVRGSAIAAGATVIDAGTTMVDGDLKGDVEYAAACERAAAITPVPGGVGPVTNLALLRNVVIAAESLNSN